MQADVEANACANALGTFFIPSGQIGCQAEHFSSQTVEPHRALDQMRSPVLANMNKLECLERCRGEKLIPIQNLRAPDSVLAKVIHNVFRPFRPETLGDGISLELASALSERVDA